MSSFQKTRLQKRKTKTTMLQVVNDIPTEEFDDYYQKCLENKKRRLNAKNLETEGNEMADNEDKLSGTTEVNNYSFGFNFSEYGEMSEESNENGDDYEEWLTNEEIDRAFEEAERWSDF